jgi:hypothetical protein
MQPIDPVASVCYAGCFWSPGIQQANRMDDMQAMLDSVDNKTETSAALS